MRIAIAQISSTVDKSANASLVADYTEAAAAQGAHLVVFPEATMQAFGTGRLDTQAEPLDGEFAQHLTNVAAAHSIVVVAGVFRPADTATRDGKTRQRIFNTAVVAFPDGTVVHYDKIHTYDAFGYRESDTVKSGDTLVTFGYEGVEFGVAVCYDLRFPEQFRRLARRGAQIIVVPISWADGEDKLRQKHLLSQARALDSTSWIVAADQAHFPDSTAPRGVGYSTVVAPDGRVVATAGEHQELLVVDVDVAEVERVRAQLPVVDSLEDYSHD